MAKGRERQNPEFDPTRIVRPTAAPVELYFRPMLRGPEPSQLMQVAEALGGISPTLNRLASDAAAAGIAAEKNAGTWQADTEADPEVLRRKATEAIEKSGGLAPWRFQSYLEAYGQREVRDKYRKALYENIDDLSNPYNADGTVRPPEYISQRMGELYDKVGLPKDSYYINKGAAVARAEADNAFYDRLMNARRQKVLQSSADTLADGLAFSLETRPDVAAEFGPNGLVKMQLDSYYQQGGQDGNDILAKTVIKVSRGLAAAGRMEEAKKILDTVLDPPSGGVAIAKRFRADVQEEYDIIERKEREEEFREAQTRETRKSLARSSAQDSILNTLVDLQAKSATPYISMTAAERVDLAKRALAGIEAPEDIKAQILGNLADWTRVQIDAMNSPAQPNARAESMVLEAAYQNSIKMPQAEFEAYLTGLLDKGLLTFQQAQAFRTSNKSFNGLPQMDRENSSIRMQPLKTWTGMVEAQIALDGRSELQAIGARAEVEVMDAWLSAVSSQEFKTKHPDEVSASFARGRELDRIVSEKVAALRSEHSDKLKQYNLSESFDSAIKPAVAQEAGQLTETILTELAIDEGYDRASLSRRFGAIFVDRARAAWYEIRSEPGQPAMSMEQRRTKFYSMLPDIADTLNLDLRERPDTLGLPQNLLNIVRSATAPDQGVVASAIAASAPAGIVASPADISRGLTASGTGAIRPAPTVLAPGPADAYFKSEAALFDKGTAASRAYQNLLRAAAGGPPSPDAVSAHNAAKRDLSKTAADMISEMSSTTPSQRFNTGMLDYYQQTHGVKSEFAANKPLFKFSPSGVLIARRTYNERDSLRAGETVENGMVYSLTPAATAKYWTAKAIIGYTAEEIKSGRTTEGITIGKAEQDANEFLYFQSTDELQAAVDEYNSSKGRSGYIAEYGLKMSGMTYADFRERQLFLLNLRKPFGR